MSESQFETTFNIETGEIIERELDNDELSEINAIAELGLELIAQQEAKAAARESALAKLADLGLTAEEIAAL
jgi:hypothetical protein